MSKKPNSKNWFDLKMMIAAVSITATLGLWNLFAARATLMNDSQALELPAQPLVVSETTTTEIQPSFLGKIILGGEAPQPHVITRSGGGGGGGQAFTQTRSS